MGYEFRVGDRVMGTKDALSHRVGTLGRVNRLQGKSRVFVLWDGENEDYLAHKNEIVRTGGEPMYDVTQKPKLWRDMTPEEKGALLLAKHDGKTVEWSGNIDDSWVVNDHEKYLPYIYYRIKPEPKRETVVLSGRMKTPDNWSFCADEVWPFDTHKITFDIIDGKPDPSSIKIEEV